MNIFQKGWNKIKNLGSSPADLAALLGGKTFGGFVYPSYRYLASEGYKCSELVYFILNDIATSGSRIPLLLDEQPDWVQELMRKPEMGGDYPEGQPPTVYTDWMYKALIHKQLGGACYALPTTGTRGRIMDLELIRPDRISPIEDNGEQLKGWNVVKYGMSKPFMAGEVFWSHKLDPLRDNYGWPAMASAAKALAQRNEISRLNMQVLANDGAVQGIMKLNQGADKMARTPDKEQMNAIKKAVNEKLGAGANGEIPVVNWDMVYERLGQTGREMDWTKTKEQNAREIAIANGYPPFLLGFSQGSTFANVSEARQFLWNHTIIPWVEGILQDLAVYLAWVSGDNSIRLEVDKSQILSIQEQLRIQAESDRKNYESELISREEWRERNGYDREVDGELKVDMRGLNGLQLPFDGNE